MVVGRLRDVLPRTSRRINVFLLTLFVGAGGCGAANAQSGEPTLLSAWLSQPVLSERQASFQYMRGVHVNDQVIERRDALVQEFDDLSWRLEGAGYDRMNATVKEWETRISGLEVFRTPGSWGPASLIAQPSKMPPFDRVDAIGACVAPQWIEVWDSHGIRRVDWQKAQSLAVLLKRVEIDVGSVGRVMVVSPEGAVRSHGAQAWNFNDTAIVPGSRVVAALPLQGKAFGWIQQTIADVLAHTPSGVECKEATLVQRDD